MWSCDEAVVSRFIKSGEPQLTFDRALSLSKKLEMSLDELNLRLQEGIAPRTKARAAQVDPKQPNKVEPASDVATAMAEANSAVQRLKELLPNAKIVFQINLGE